MRGNKKVRFYCSLILVGFCLFFISLPYSHAQHSPSESVAIIMDGKQYASIFEYRRQQIKNVLINTLSADNLQMFTEEELCRIVAEVHKQKTTDSPKHNQRKTQDDALDQSPAQMQEMLDDYLSKHKNVDPIILNPTKIKNIVIEPKAEPKNIP